MSKLTDCYQGLMHFPWLKEGKWATMQNRAQPPNYRANWESVKHFNTYEEALLDMNNWNTVVEIHNLRSRGFDCE